MTAIGQDMAVLSLNPPGVRPYDPAAAVPPARDFNDALAAIVRGHPDRFGDLGTVAPQDPVAAAEIERIMGTARAARHHDQLAYRPAALAHRASDRGARVHLR